MVKKKSGSSAQGKHRVKNVRHIADARLNFSDIPELSKDQLRKARRVGRPSTGNAKQLIAIRISPELLAQLKRIAYDEGRPYQTLMHELLEHAVKRHAA
jgi:uncharacterized protein (DUF4415 family)